MRMKLAAALLLFSTVAWADGVPKFSASVAGTPVQLKNRAGLISWLYCGALAGPDYLQIWDQATAPTPGTTAPVASLPWTANTALSPVLGDGMKFFKGIYVAVTTTANGATGGGPVACTFGLK